VKVLKLLGSDKVRNNGLQAVASHCHQIQDLRLGLQYISDEVFTFMATQPIPKTFNSFDFIGESNNKCVTDQGLVPFFQSIPKIQNISLSYVRCPELLLLLSEAQVDKETNSVLPPKASSLRSLNLHLCKGIEGKPVEELAKACSSLRTLEITYGLTPTSITNFSINCKNTLQSVSLPYQVSTEIGGEQRGVKA
jgi:hypothetical protein